MTETYEEFLRDAKTNEMFHGANLIEAEASYSNRLPRYNIYAWGKDLLESDSDLSEDQVCYIIKNLRRTAAGYMTGPAGLTINHVTVIANISIGFDTIEDLVDFDFTGMHLHRIIRQGDKFVVKCGKFSHKGR